MRILRDRKTRSAAIAILAGAIGVLALVNWYLAASPLDTSPITPGTGLADGSRQGSSDLTTPLDKKPVGQFQETVGRPLFNPTRKPVERKAASVPAARSETSDMRLIGVMKSGHGPGRALIRIAEERTGKWVVEGEQFNGWKLREVSERRVVLEAGGRSHELTIQQAHRETEEPGGPEPARKSR